LVREHVRHDHRHWRQRTASKDRWKAGMGGAWNGAWNGATADQVHQSVAAYSALAVFLAQILML
jgi:hypothetical protein